MNNVNCTDLISVILNIFNIDTIIIITPKNIIDIKSLIVNTYSG